MNAELLIDLQREIRDCVGITLFVYEDPAVDELVLEINYKESIMMYKTRYARAALVTMVAREAIEEEQRAKMEQAIDLILDSVDWTTFYAR